MQNFRLNRVGYLILKQAELCTWPLSVVFDVAFAEEGGILASDAGRLLPCNQNAHHSGLSRRSVHASRIKNI